jgi:hypothetical protein
LSVRVSPCGGARRLSARSYRRNRKPSGSKVRLSRIQNKRLERLGRLDGLLWEEAVRPFRRWWHLFLGGELRQIYWAKNAKSNRRRQNDDSKNYHGPDGRTTTRPQEPYRALRQSLFIKSVFMIFRQRRLSVIVAGAAHFFAFSPSSTRRRNASERLASFADAHASTWSIKVCGIRAAM